VWRKGDGGARRQRRESNTFAGPSRASRASTPSPVRGERASIERVYLGVRTKYGSSVCCVWARCDLRDRITSLAVLYLPQSDGLRYMFFAYSSLFIHQNCDTLHVKIQWIDFRPHPTRACAQRTAVPPPLPTPPLPHSAEAPACRRHSHNRGKGKISNRSTNNTTAANTDAPKAAGEAFLIAACTGGEEQEEQREGGGARFGEEEECVT